MLVAFEQRRCVLPAACLCNVLPRRFFYSTTEISANAENLQAAITRQGPDNFGTRVYWDTKPAAAQTCS